MNPSEFLRQFVEQPKWLSVQTIVLAAVRGRNRIKLIVCTNDGGKAAGLPREAVKGAFTSIDVTPLATTPFLQVSDDLKGVLFEAKIGGKVEVLTIPVGVIKAIKIDGVQLPQIYPCWPTTADSTAYNPSPVFEGCN